MIYTLIVYRSCEQFSMTSCWNSRLLWHIFRELSTHLAISKQNLSMSASKFFITANILVKQSTADNRLNGSGWFELDSILLISDLIFAGSVCISLSVICFKLQRANSATALLHISLKVELFLDYAPSIRESNSDSTSGFYIFELENHLTI